MKMRLNKEIEDKYIILIKYKPGKYNKNPEKTQTALSRIIHSFRYGGRPYKEEFIERPEFRAWVYMNDFSDCKMYDTRQEASQMVNRLYDNPEWNFTQEDDMLEIIQAKDVLLDRHFI